MLTTSAHLFFVFDVNGSKVCHLCVVIISQQSYWPLLRSSSVERDWQVPGVVHQSHVGMQVVYLLLQGHLLLPSLFSISFDSRCLGSYTNKYYDDAKFWKVQEFCMILLEFPLLEILPVIFSTKLVKNKNKWNIVCRKRLFRIE